MKVSLYAKWPRCIFRLMLLIRVYLRFYQTRVAAFSILRSKSVPTSTLTLRFLMIPWFIIITIQTAVKENGFGWFELWWAISEFCFVQLMSADYLSCCSFVCHNFFHHCHLGNPEYNELAPTCACLDHGLLQLRRQSDSFVGGFLSHLVQEKSMEDFVRAGRYAANLMSTLNNGKELTEFMWAQ
ncbi:hypothetical protein IEQ34_008183 [Dendrobium chrysotoxum]|uniref:Uncharacterized protein n=1 Tax=Dendrobium chrysotoxum TaxID=161865 RepID=A0AAV7H3E8_DENCH|nr:hypothetical protein IEQ34_008183 [Dendrobium chrysotoxum]